MSDTRNFEEASRQIRENLSKHIAKYDIIQQTDEESEEEDNNEEDVTDKLVDAMLANYSNMDPALVKSARDALKGSLHTTSCLICIENIRKTDSIWNCSTCYASFHLSCVAKWSKV